MFRITQDEVIEIVIKIIEKNPNNKHHHSTWQIIDYINGLGQVTVAKAVEILESLDQEDEDVKELRRDLKL